MADRFDDLRRDLDTAASDRTGRRLFGAATPDTAVSALRTAPAVGVDPNALVQDPTTLQKLDRTATDSAALRDAPKVRSFIDQNEVNAALASDELPALSGLERTQAWAGDSAQELFGWNRDDRFQGGFGLAVEGATKIGTGAVATTRGFIASGRAVEAVETLQTMQMIANGEQPSGDQMSAAGFLNSGILVDPDGVGTVTFPDATPDQQVAMMSAVSAEFTDADADVTDAALMVALMMQQNPQGPALSIDNIPAIIGFYGVQSTALAIPALIAGAVGGRQIGMGALLGQGFGTGFAEATKRDIIADGPAAFYSDDTFKKGLVVAPMFAALDVLGPVGRVLRRPFAAIPEDLILKAIRAKTLPKQVGAVLAGGALEEAIAEMGQEMLVDWGNGELDWTTEGITKYLEAAAIGALVGGPMTAVLETPALVVQARRNSDAQRDGVTNSTLQQIQDQAGGIQLRERSPEKWREFLQAIGTDKGRMYIEGDALQAAVDAGTVDLALLGVAPEQVKTAIDAGGRVQISQLDWAANYAGTDVGQTVLENSAARADGYTPAQLRNFEDLVAQTDAESTFTAEQTVELDKRTDALRSARRLTMRGEGMSQAEAKANATLQAAAVRTLASRTGDMAVFDQFQLDIEGTSVLGKQRAADTVSGVLGTPAAAPRINPKGLENVAENAAYASIREEAVAARTTDAAARTAALAANPNTALPDDFSDPVLPILEALDNRNVNPDTTIPELMDDAYALGRPDLAQALADFAQSENLFAQRITQEEGDVPSANRAQTEASAQQTVDRAQARLDRNASSGQTTLNQKTTGGTDGQRSDTGGRTRSGGLSALEGAPTVRGVSGPDPRLVAVAEQYAADNGIDLKRQSTFTEVDPEFAARVADAYEAMEHNPQDPAVKEAYDSLIQQTTAQYQALVDAGYQFYFIDLRTQEGQDYASSPWNAMFDARDNQIMGVFSTAEGFGTSEDFNADANPMLAETGIEWPLGPNGETRPVYANDLFRAVHDAFGHGLEFTGFRANGEENAWQAHQRLFTGSAVAAITTETRGQNSWLNYGPNGEANRAASVEDTVFADQKTGLLPDFAWTENVSPDDTGDVRTFEQSGVELFDNPLDIEGKVTVKAIGQAMTDDHLSKEDRQLFPEDSEEDYQQVYDNVAGELGAQLQQPNSGAGWYSKDVQDAIDTTAEDFPEIATEEGRATWLTFAGIFSNGLDPAQAWEISAEAFQYWTTFGEIPVNRADAARRLGNEVRMTSYKDKAGKKVVKEAGWGVRNPANEQQLTMFKNLVEREGSPKAAVDWMLSPQPREAINEIVLTAQSTPRFKTKAEREGPEQWGALMFSEKLGRYTMGLHGFQITEEDTTVDLWYTRTYRRLTGRLMEKPLGKEGVAAQPDPAKGGIERKTIFRLTGDLGRQFGLEAGDVQAMLWFFEKRLWGAQGLRTDEGTNSAGARRLIEKRAAANDGAAGAAADQGISGAAGRTLNQSATDTAAFNAWFGDSKVVDENGDPLVVYHGTEQEFDQFSPDEQAAGKLGKGFYFTPNEGAAGFFSRVRGNKAGTARIVATYVSLQNPLIYASERDLPVGDIQQAAIKDAGYDGIILQDGSGGVKELIVFEPTQIKSVDNVGTFDAADPRILNQAPANPFPDTEVTARVYHRTSADFEKFEINSETGESAIFFGADPDNLPQFHNRKKYGDRTVPAFVDVQNPLMIDEFNLKEMQERWGGGSKEFPFMLTAQTVSGLRDAGFDGVIIEDVYGNGDPDEIAVFNEGQVASALDPTRMLNQEGARGQINLPENVRTGESLIQLFESSDPSTMAHEFSHYLIEVMRSIGSTDGAPQQVTEDLEIVHAWMEETTGEAVDGNYSTAQQEAWAEAFENYLMSGVAPSPSLKVVFRKFALWLATVYKTAVGAGTQPSPEVRGVMDRLLATDQEIAAVQLENNDGAMFGDKPPFMSADEWETYRKVAERGDAEAQGKLLNRAMESARKKQTKEWKAFYAEALIAATADLSEEREYVLIAALGDKDNNFGRGARLDRDMLVSMFGTAILDDLKALKAPQLIYVKDGADIDQVADMFGFKNGAHMVQTLRTVKPMAEQAEANARAAADSLAPPLTPAEMQEEAEASLKNPTRIERVAREGAALSKASGGVASSWTVMNRAAKARAEQLVGEMNVRQAGNYRQFSVAARKAAREAQTQLAKVVRLADGTPTAGGMAAMGKAAAAKRQQLLNDHMYNTARERAKAFDKARKRFAKTDTKKGRAKIDPDYMDQADALLSQYDFRQRTVAQVKESTNARASLAEFILLQQEAGVDGELAIAPQVLLRGNVPLNYTELTVDALEAVVDAIDNLIHAGKAVQKSYLENQTLMYGEMVSEITTNMDLKMKAKARPDRESGQRSRIPKFLGALNHNIETALTTIRRMDGWEDNGPAMRFIFRPLQQAAAAVEERREQETVALKEVYNRHYSKQEVRQLNDKRKHGIYVPELGDTFSKAGLLSIALNSGNAGNFQRLTDVEGVKGNGAYDADSVNAALKKHMTEADWRFVQDMWDHIGGFWTEISALEREVSGVVPKQVDSVLQVEAPDFVTGGYYPISYDADLNIASFLSGADDAYKDATGGRSGKAQTRSGHVEARLRATGMALDLNLGVAENHIMKVTHDLAMRKPINHAVKMLNNPAIGEALNTFGRNSDLQALRSWLVDSAAGDSISADSMGGVMRYARKALTVKYIGFSLATLTLQPLGAIQAGAVVGNRNLAAAYVKYAGRAKYWNSFIQTNSAHMRLRVRAVNREVNEFAREARTAETAGSGAVTRWTNMVTSASLAPIGHVQYWTVDIPVFIAAFEKARGEGIAEADAISLAENAVDRSSGSGSFLNRASFERGTSSDSARRTEYIKTFTMLASYVHSKYNAYVELKGRTDFLSVTDTMKFSISMMQLFVWEAAVVSLYRSIGDESDDDEGTAAWLASTVGAEVVGLHPVTRPFSGYVSGYGTGTTPLTDFAELLADGVSSGGDIVTGEGDLRDWLNTFDAAATPFMLPTGQINKIIRAITADEPAAQLGRVAMGLSPLRQ